MTALCSVSQVFSMGNNAYGQCGRRIVEDEVYRLVLTRQHRPAAAESHVSSGSFWFSSHPPGNWKNVTGKMSISWIELSVSCIPEGRVKRRRTWPPSEKLPTLNDGFVVPLVSCSNSGSHIIHKIQGFDSRVTQVRAASPELKCESNLSGLYLVTEDAALFFQVACGQDHSLFLTETGKVFACGWGADGQTGQCSSQRPWLFSYWTRSAADSRI